MSDRKRHKRKGLLNKADFFSSGDIIAKEKLKARNLRSSSWWKRLTSEGRCHYCGRTFNPGDLTMDHIIPLSRGGESERFNIVAACKECNNKKKYLLPAEWDEYLEMLKNSK